MTTSVITKHKREGTSGRVRALRDSDSEVHTSNIAHWLHTGAAHMAICEEGT